LFFYTEDALRIPPVVAVQYAHARKDDLWWKNNQPTDRDLVKQHNSGSSMLVALALQWTSGGEERLVDQPWVEKTTIHQETNPPYDKLDDVLYF